MNIFLNMKSVCVIEALADPSKEKMKQSDTNISDWLQSKLSSNNSFLLTATSNSKFEAI